MSEILYKFTIAYSIGVFLLLGNKLCKNNDKLCKNNDKLFEKKRYQISTPKDAISYYTQSIEENYWRRRERNDF